MVRGPLAQLIPTTAAPASSRRRQASGIGTPSIVSSGQYGAKVMTAGTPIECIVQRQQSLTTVDMYNEISYRVGKFPCNSSL